MKILRILIAIAASALAGTASGQTLTVLHSFAGGSDGASPQATLIQGSDGNFYGTAVAGGATGSGTVFRVSLTGTYTNLYSFAGVAGRTLPRTPYGGLAQGSDGNFYGTTTRGGTSNYGTVFMITPSGNFTNLYSFESNPNDGVWPEAGLVLGADGNFYGTTMSGGGAGGLGTVFRMSPSGSETNLHSFKGFPKDGAIVYAGLVQGSDGNFYGTTYEGGTSTNCSQGCGTVFRISASGILTNLHSFSGTDGANPYDTLVQGSDGDFYGTTAGGGVNTNCGSIGCGTVFRISPSGNFTNLYSFNGIDDAAPAAGLVQGSDGNFYGTVYYGGATGTGVVIRVSPGGGVTNLWSFSGSDGANPYGGLVQGSDGNLYGTTRGGGTSGSGTVFRLSVPLHPPPNQIGEFQPSGSNLVFTISSVAGETYQLQFTTDLVSGNWSNVVGVCVSNSIGAALTVTNFGAATGSQRFYRFAITP